MDRLGLYLPFGIFPGEIPDPDKLMKELREAARVAGAVGQQNWTRDALTLDLFSSDVVQLHAKEATADGNILNPAWPTPLLPDLPGADPSWWKVPYNSGYRVVGSGSVSDPMTVSWVSDSLELVIAIATCWYTRTTGGTTYTPRTQLGIELDGTVVDGAAAQSEPPWGQVRGCGVAAQDTAFCSVFPVILLPGAHTASMVAGQALATLVDLATGQEVDDSLLYEVTDKVCVGSRALYVIRIGMGGAL